MAPNILFTGRLIRKMAAKTRKCSESESSVTAMLTIKLCQVQFGFHLPSVFIQQESPADARVTCDSIACMKAPMVKIEAQSETQP